jgi:ribonuclease-3
LSEADPALDDVLGHTFADENLLRAAFTHSSAGKGRRKGPSPYERLEFLGDRVLGLVLAETLFRRFPSEPEGDLTRRMAALARRETVAEIARAIGLDKHIELARDPSAAAARTLETALSDGCEALIGALYIDGGLDVAAAFIRRHWAAAMDVMEAPPHDAKTALQEWLQARGHSLPTYRIIGQEGPPHAPVFKVGVSGAKSEAEAEGRSRRLAEQAAAAALLKALESGNG